MTFVVKMLRGLVFSTVILGNVVFGSAILSVVTAGGAVAQSASSIVVEGNRRVEADTIRSYFRPGPGEKLDAVKIDEALKALYATGLFEDVKINQAGGRLVVSVVEAQVINRIAFEGNKRIKDDQLTAEIQSKPRGALSRATVQSDVQRIVDVYHRGGRFDVDVNPKIIELPNNRVDLVFEITEGQKTTVRKINFIGNHAFSDTRLRDVIKTTQTNLLSFLKNTNVYDPDRVEADRDLIRRFYLTKGYADVRVTSAAVEFDPAQKGFVITFTVDEGPLYRFGTVDVRSNLRDLDPALLRAKLKVETGEPYNIDAVDKSTEDMTVEMSKRGFPFAQVVTHGDRNADTHLISVVFDIEEGARAYIERINIIGNTRTRDYVIRREFDIGEGDAYNKVLVDRAERRLKGLNYFKTVKITNEPGSAPDRVVLNVEVEEQPTGEFAVSGGYSTAAGALGEVSVGERNLLGKGQLAKISVQYGQFVKGAEFNFAEPYFLDYHLGFGLDLFARQTLANDFQSFGTETVGFSTRFIFPLREDLSLSLRYSLYRQSEQLDPGLLFCDPTIQTCASLAVRQSVIDGAALTSLVGYGLTYSTLDNARNPTHGLIVNVLQDFAGVGGDVDYVKSTFDASYYHEVFGEIVGLVRGQGGYITPWNGQQVRLLDNFFGGPNLVRGFAPNGFGPRDLTPGTTQDNVGGTVYWAVSAELQSPIPNLPKDIGLKAAVFFDAGSVFDYRSQIIFPALNNQSIQLADSRAVRSAVGAGLIWDSPFGPLRFDYAIATSKQSYDVIQQFRFGGGTKF